MADGHVFDPRAFTAASPGLPMGRIVRVCALREPVRCTTVRITDRGPAKWTGRIIDLTPAAMAAIGGIHAGVITVSVEPL